VTLVKRLRGHVIKIESRKTAWSYTISETVQSSISSEKKTSCIITEPQLG